MSCSILECFFYPFWVGRIAKLELFSLSFASSIGQVTCRFRQEGGLALRGKGLEKEPPHWDQNTGNRKCGYLSKGSGLFLCLCYYFCFLVSLLLVLAVWLGSLFILNISTSLSCSKENKRDICVHIKTHTYANRLKGMQLPYRRSIETTVVIQTEPQN